MKAYYYLQRDPKHQIFEIDLNETNVAIIPDLSVVSTSLISILAARQKAQKCAEEFHREQLNKAEYAEAFMKKVLDDYDQGC